ncbi:MAG: hypothetical protein DMG39_07695 [Acidobacteria bacterium]|nr:MAG: hypothetical protein DMG39_07695 [Acidobacteriota bacterium]
MSRFVLSPPPSCFNMRCMGAILEVRDLRVTYHPPKGGSHRALDGVSFHLEPGEVMGVLGESGSGKSTLATSLLGLFHANAVAVSGEVLLEGRNLLQAKLEELEKIRGKCISLIFQEPSVALHPTMRTGRQVRQVLAAHGVKCFFLRRKQSASRAPIRINSAEDSASAFSLHKRLPVGPPW